MAIYNAEGTQLFACYNADGETIDVAYNADGDAVFYSALPDYDRYTIEDYRTFSFTNMQAFDIYKNFLWQLRASSVNIGNVYNLKTLQPIATDVQIASGHGNTASFSNEFYDENDILPLFYCCNGIDSPNNRVPTSVTINRVTTSGATLIKTLLFRHPIDVYWGYACFDFENNIAYTVGLSMPSFTSDYSGDNKTVITKWDMSNLTDNGDGTYDATYISHYMIDFIYVMQGMQFRNGIIWISSGYNNTTYPQMVYGVDAETGEIVHSIATGITAEIEGIAWLDDFHLVAGFMSGNYKLITFGEKTA